jgi:hypothetical protein
MTLWTTQDSADMQKAGDSAIFLFRIREFIGRDGGDRVACWRSACFLRSVILFGVTYGGKGIFP